VEVIHERGLVQNTLLCKGMQIIRVRESLDEFQLELEADAIRCLGLVNGRLRHFYLDICEVSVGSRDPSPLHFIKVSVSPCGKRQIGPKKGRSRVPYVIHRCSNFLILFLHLP